MNDEIVRLDVKPMREELQQLIVSHGLDGVQLALVPSVHDWLIANRRQSNNEFRQASIVQLDDETIWIAVLDEVTSEHPGRTSLVIHVGLDDYEWIAADLRRYARHLVLHEIAHVVLGTRDETTVDRWTVPELRKLEQKR